MRSALPIQQKSVRMAPAVALGFFVIGILCLSASIAILSIHPEILTGEPYRTEVVAFAALVSFGFVGSFVFGAAYVISPVMATSSLFSARLAALHLLLHGGGMGWLVVTYGGMQFLENPESGFFSGIGLLVVGALIHVVNLLSTASQRNRWEPEQLTSLSALFWLGITSGLGIIILLSNWIPAVWQYWLETLKVHAPLGLVGFLWLSMLGFCLKIYSMFLVSEKSAGSLSWIGWIGTNAALLLFVIVLNMNEAAAVSITMALLCLGGVFYIADIVRLWFAAQRPMDWALTGSFIGLIAGFALLLWILISMLFHGSLEKYEIRDVAFIFFVVGIFGIFTLTMLGLSMRLIPFLIWLLRCAPMIGSADVPQPASLVRQRGGFGLMICLGAAGVYFAIGQWSQSVIAAQLGTVCLFCGLFWLLWSLLPAFKIFVFGIPRLLR